MENEINQILKAYSQRPIAYFPIYAQITGSVTAGILLSQLMYWHYAMEGKEFYKTDENFSNDLSMGLYEFKGAKSKIKDLKIAEITKKGIPAKTWYKVDAERVVALITSYGKNPQLVKGKTHNLPREKPTTITYTNTDTNTDKRNKERSELDNFSENLYNTEFQNLKKEITPQPDNLTTKKDDKIKMTSVSKTDKYQVSKQKQLTEEEKKIFKVYTKYVGFNANEKTISVLENVPQTLAIFKEYYPTNAVEKFEEAVSSIMADSYWLKEFNKVPIRLSPKLFLNPKWVRSVLVSCLDIRIKKECKKEDDFTNDPDVIRAKQKNKEYLAKLNKTNICK